MAILKNKSSGFTLIELSIVIVIIGLLVAGIVGGQNLIEASKSRQMMSDINMIKTAYNTFRLEYNAVPGDMDNATAYWPAGPDTVDGNGDGKISGAEDGFGISHMYLARLLPMAVDDTNTQYMRTIIGPYTTNGQQAYQLRYHSASEAYGREENALLIGGKRDTTTAHTVIFLTPVDALRIDTKYDDAIPNTGILLGGNGSVDSTSGSASLVCTSTPGSNWDVTTSMSYGATDSTPQCRMVGLIE